MTEKNKVELTILDLSLLVAKHGIKALEIINGTISLIKDIKEDLKEKESNSKGA